MNFEEARRVLTESAEKDFAAFSSKIISTEYPLLGVRTPKLKQIARQLDENYLEHEPKYYEELMLQGFLLGRTKKTPDELFAALPAYLSRVDNWAAIDSPSSAFVAIRKNKAECFERVKEYCFDERTFFARFGAVTLLGDYIEESYIDEVLDIYERMRSGEYYVDMAVAWGLSVCAVKFFDKTYEKLRKGNFSEFVLSKAISKCCDSFRISSEQKQELKALRKKKSK